MALPEKLSHFPHIPVPDFRGGLRWAKDHLPLVGGGALTLAGLVLGYQMVTGDDRGPQSPPQEPNKASDPFKPPEGQPSVGIVPPQSPDNPSVSAPAGGTGPDGSKPPEANVENAPCNILPPKLCSQVERKPVMINGVEDIYIVFHNTSQEKVPVFAAADGKFLDNVPESGTPFTGIKSRVSIGNGAYIVSGDLDAELGQTKDPKKGIIAAYVLPGGTVYITKTLITPNGLVTDEALLKSLFHLK